MNKNNIQELEIPLAIHSSEKAMELVRIWIADKKLIVTLSGNLWKDPRAWGLLLVDLAKHVANAYAQNGEEKQAVYDRIIEGFMAEYSHATDDPKPL